MHQLTSEEMNDAANKSRNKCKKTKKKTKEKNKRGSHGACSKYMGYVFHAREQVATTDGQDMIRDIINHLSHVWVSCWGGEFGLADV